MSHLPFTYEPLNTLKPIGSDLWIVDGPKIRMSAGPITIPFPTRMTVVRLEGGIWLHSPIAYDRDLHDEIAELGPIRWIIAPNKIHYAGVQSWIDACPDAQSWGVEGIEERAAQNGIPVTLHHRFDQNGAPPWAGQIDQITLRSRFMDEIAFFHRASRTLILTDFVEAFAPERVGLGFRVLLKLGANLGPIGSTPRDYRAMFWGRRKALRQSVEAMLAWKPQQVIIAHGECYLDDAEAKLRTALAWALK